MSVGLMAAYVFRYTWCFAGALASNMWPSLIFGKDTVVSYDHWGDFIKARGEVGRYMVDWSIGVGVGIFIGCILIFMYINYPGRKRELALIKGTWVEEKTVLALRFLCGLLFMLIPLIDYFWELM
jgi:hypothetical protein